MKLQWTTLLILIALGVLSEARSAENEGRPQIEAPEAVAKIDALVNTRINTNHVPGMSVAVVYQGRLILAKGYGKANLELSVPVTQETVYEIASLTKQFTAAAVLLLRDRGLLSLSDPIGKYLLGGPLARQNITIRHLLTHTSGIRECYDIPAFRSKTDFAWEKDFTPQEFFQILAAQPLEFQPGKKYAYSNDGYYLLGMIIERASGKPYEHFLRENILLPLGMSSTRRMSRMHQIANRASGYNWSEKDHEMQNSRFTSATWAYSEGGLVSTITDMVKWDRALDEGKILKKSTLQAMWFSSELNDRTKTKYGMGWNVGSNPRYKQIYHSGNKPGFSSIIRRYLDDRLTVIVLCNQETGADLGAISFEIASFFIPHDHQ